MASTTTSAPKMSQYTVSVVGVNVMNVGLRRAVEAARAGFVIFFAGAFLAVRTVVFVVFFTGGFFAVAIIFLLFLYAQYIAVAL